jgi:Flp pilus assembly CpaF family ATPase
MDVVVAGTQAGKTTLLNALCTAIPAPGVPTMA